MEEHPAGKCGVSTFLEAGLVREHFSTNRLDDVLRLLADTQRGPQVDAHERLEFGKISQQAFFEAIRIRWHGQGLFDHEYPVQSGFDQGSKLRPGWRHRAEHGSNIMDSAQFESIVAQALEVLELEGREGYEVWCRGLSDLAPEVDARIRALADAGLLEQGEIPPSIEGFEIHEKLGLGGMGVVYRARQLAPFERDVALKCPRQDRLHPEQLRRFETEYRTLAQLEHAAIARVFDAGRTRGGALWFSMELIRGEPVTLSCNQRRATIDERIRLFVEVGLGIEHAHRHGVLHRDIKPSNVLVSEDAGQPRIRIIDFGLARTLTSLPDHRDHSDVGGPPIGTLDYASPEQIAGRPGRVDVRSDVFSLGVLLFELLSGRLPRTVADLRGMNRNAIEDRLRDVPPEPLFPRDARRAEECARERGYKTVSELRRNLPRDLERVVHKAVAVDPEQRYESVRDFLSDLDRFRGGFPVRAAPPRWGYRAGRWMRRNRSAVAMLLTLISVVAVALAVTANQALGWRRTVDKLDLLASADTLEALLESDRNNPIPALPHHLPRLREFAAELDRRIGDLSNLSRSILDIRTERMGGSASDHARLMALESRLTATQVMLELPSTPEARDAHRVYRTVDFLEHRSARAESISRAPERDDDWADVRARLAAKFEGKSGPNLLSPIPGLIPLGPDPASGLEEFALSLVGAALPRRRGDGALELPDRFAPVLVLLPGGPARLGVQSEDPLRRGFDSMAEPEEMPEREATFPPFLIGKYEVSSDQWLCMTGERVDSSHFYQDIDDDSDCPRNNVSWRTANWVVRAYGLRLPSEDEWEYAARGGAPTPWFTGSDPMAAAPAANVYDQSTEDPQLAKRLGLAGRRVRYSGRVAPFSDGWVVSAPVHSGLPNPFGLHHVIGNVREICDGPYVREDRIEPDQRPYRGASWHSSLWDGRASARMSVDVDEQSSAGGIRVAMDWPK